MTVKHRCIHGQGPGVGKKVWKGEVGGDEAGPAGGGGGGGGRDCDAQTHTWSRPGSWGGVLKGEVGMGGGGELGLGAVDCDAQMHTWSRPGSWQRGGGALHILLKQAQ